MGIWLVSHGNKCQYEMRSYGLGSRFSKEDIDLGEKQY